MKRVISLNRTGYLVKNTLLLALGNFGTKFVSFLLVPLFTHMLTPEEYGTIDLASTIITLAVPILSFNIAEAVMRFSLDPDADLSKIISTAVLLMGIAVVGAWIFSPIMRLIIADNASTNYIVFYLISSICSQIMMGALRGREFLLQYAIGNILQISLSAGLAIAFLTVCDLGNTGYFLAYGLAGMITAIYAFVVGKIGTLMIKFSFDRKLTFEMLKYSMVLIPNSFMWWIMSSSDRLMVTHMLGAGENGVYAVAYKLPSIVSMLASVFNQAWSYSAIKEKQSKDGNEYINDVFKGLVTVSLIVAGGLLLILKPFMRVFVSSEYYGAWRYAPPLIVGVAFLALGSFAATTYTVYKVSMGFLKSGTMGAVLNVVLNILLIPTIGAYGAALATGISYIAVFVYRAIDTQKYIKIQYLCKQNMLGFAILVLMGMTVFIDGPMGYALLAVELMCMFVLFRQQIRTIVIGCFEKVKKYVC